MIPLVSLLYESSRPRNHLRKVFLDENDCCKIYSLGVLSLVSRAVGKPKTLYSEPFSNHWRAPAILEDSLRVSMSTV